MKFTGKLNSVLRTYENEFLLTLKTKESLSEDEISNLKDKEQLSIEIKEYRKHRSLNANAYFHLLVHQIAEMLKIGNDECKIKMNLEYGTPKKLDAHTLFALKVPKNADISDIVKYPKWVKEVYEDGKYLDVYIVYKETHTLDTSEMSRLIDGTIYEAKQLGINTITETEKNNLLSLWKIVDIK